MGGLILRVWATEEEMSTAEIGACATLHGAAHRKNVPQECQRALFGGIPILGGFSLAQTISLRFERGV
jgi:hypothetical protein